MEITDLLIPACVYPAIKAQSKKQLFLELSAQAAKHIRLPDKQIFEMLSEREHLGTTGVGQGIAIPHGRHTAIDRIVGLFARVTPAVDYDAVDHQPVDLIFMLLAPENAGADHLKALARVSRLLRNHAVCEKLRAASGAEELFAILTAPAEVHSAAA